jgi:hypothetical protein
MIETARELLDENGYQDWDVVDDSILSCPHGNEIEWDGACPDGCVSPLRELGVI